QGVVDRRVAVRVELAHHLADHALALDMALLGPQPHLGHHVEDAPLDGLETVAGVRERPRVDHRIGVLQERRLISLVTSMSTIVSSTASSEEGGTVLRD